MENFGKFMTIVLAMIISPIVNGFVIMKLWAWFITPTFNIHELRLVEAIGLMFLVNYLLLKRDKDVNKDSFWEQFIANILYLFIMAGFALFSGWIVSMFM